MQERRQAERFRRNLHALGEFAGSGRGAVCDRSAMGCFVLAAGQTETNELIRLEIQFPNHLLLVWGQTVHNVAEMGFAVCFVFSQENEARAVRKLIEKLN
jgi:hypothetical protein